MKKGDVVELAIWLTGEESDEQIEHWKTVVGERARTDTERKNEVEIGPWAFSIKYPGEERVPPVPPDVAGFDVRLLVAEAKVGNRRTAYIVKQTGFVEDLTKKDRQRLREITRKAHRKMHPGDRLTDQHCDSVIEALGPDVAVQLSGMEKITEREPTPDEQRNGWTKESLGRYLRERAREKEAFALIEAKRRPLPTSATTKQFNPHDW